MVSIRLRFRHRDRVRVSFRPITVRSAVPFRKYYHILVKSGTRRSRSVPQFRSVPEIIPTQRFRFNDATRPTAGRATH